MVEKPENHIGLFETVKDDIVCVQQETTYHLQRVLSSIRDIGSRESVAINPATPILMIKYVIPDVDIVCIMTVNPGFAGQRLVPETLNKVKELKALIDEKGLNIEIEVDGNVSFENAAKMKVMGADIFVAGTSSLSNKEISMEEAGKRLRSIIV